MRRALITGIAFGCLAVAAGCSSILGIPNRSLEWCLRPENAHAFCEDFDHQNVASDWTAAPIPIAGTRTFVSTDYNPPNALAMDTAVDPLMTGIAGSSGLSQSFPDQVFGQVVVGVDVRFISVNFMADPDDPNLQTGAGFLLLSDVVTGSAMGPSECIGLALAPATGGQVSIDVVLVPNAIDCFAVNPLVSDAGAAPMDDASAGMDTTPIPSPLASVFLDQWFRLTMTVTRLSDGSGTIDFSVPAGSSMAPPTIPAGSLSLGHPQIAIGTDVIGPSGPIEIQFDNVTVDFSPSN